MCDIRRLPDGSVNCVQPPSKHVSFFRATGLDPRYDLIGLITFRTYVAAQHRGIISPYSKVTGGRLRAYSGYRSPSMPGGQGAMAFNDFEGKSGA